MTEIVQRWVQDRLGVILNMCPELFAERVKDGHLLASVLKSYEVITQEQLNLVEKSDLPEICLANYKDHILIWLNSMGIFVDNEELFQIVNAKGTAALNLFYQVYLELHANNNLYFITQQRLKEKLRPTSRFKVHRVREKQQALEKDTTKRYDTPLREAQDIIHWQKDKLQVLQAKCKEARQQYILYVRSCQSPKTKLSQIDSSQRFVTSEPGVLDRAESVNLSYEQLVKEREEANLAQTFVPDSRESKKILTKFRIKQRQHAENLIFKTELQRDIFTSFWDGIKKEEEDRYNKNITDAVLKQSLYERQMHQKIGEVKLQKQVMLENKRNEAHTISMQMESDFIQKLVEKDKDMEEKELAYYLEKERVMQLHRRLYQEKLNVKAERGRKICKEAVIDLVKIASNEAEYRQQVGEEPTRRVRNTWKKMFTSSIPFDDYITPTETILINEESRPEDIEEIVHLEIDRQEMIDKKDMESYMAFEWPWSLDNIEVDEETVSDMACSLNILGNLVHNLLVAKYPFPPLPPKPHFPDITVSVCINGIDTQCLPVLQQILELKQILLIQMQDCVNFCVESYVDETTVEKEEGEEEDKAKAKKPKEKGKGKEKKKSEEKYAKKRKGAKSKANIPKDFEQPEVFVDKHEMVDKMVQTPKYYPEDAVPLSKRAELGKVAMDELQAGKPLTNHILAAMFVEYLKAKPDIKGWALINYPQTYEEAAILEEALTGLPVPRLGEDTCTSIFDLADLEANPNQTQESDEYEKKRVSKILPQPVVPPQPGFYDTALTAYIKVIKRKTIVSSKDKESVSSLKAPVIPSDSEKESIHPALEDLEDTADPLDRFYADLGCNYHFYYQRIDYNAVKYLAKLVLGDYSLPPKTSVELFGEAINYISMSKSALESEPPTSAKKGQKKEKPKEKVVKLKTKGVSDMEVKKSERKVEREVRSKTILKPGKGKKGKRESAAVVIIVHEDKWTQIPEQEEEEEEIVEVVMDPMDLPKPGETGWNYVNLPLEPSMQAAMATLWENVEEVYLVDMEQMFFMKRLILNGVMPFISSVKEHMSSYMNRPDEKQKHLREFQKIYNEFDDDFRNDDDFKSEVHCRINQMREKLIEICDWKMIAADHERVFIIAKNWTARELIQLVNNYLIGFQLELDRYADTTILLNDYYNAIVTKLPNDAIVIKETLPRLETEDPNYTKSVNKLLQQIDDSQEQMFRKFVEAVEKRALSFVDANHNSSKSYIKRVKDLIEMDKKAKEKAKATKEKEIKEKKKGSCDLGEEVSHIASEIIEEWTCAIRGEVARVKVRLALLKADLFQNLEETLGNIRKVFYSIYDQIREQHQKEMDSINAVCRVLATAVEREIKIQEELVLDKIDFYADPEVILFPDKLPPVRPLEESVRTGVFTICQLDKVADILMDLAPTGYMPERSFSYLLQDMIVNKDEPSLVPDLWQRLLPNQVNRISSYLFDELEYVQWKDFILLNLMIPFPTDEALLQLRKSFRFLDPDITELISEYQYPEVTFWFESAVEDQYRLKLMRNLLFKLYRVKTDQMNYPALLLDFCKSENPVAGLAKALGVSLGNLVCWEKDKGEHFVEMARRKRKNKELALKRKELLEEGKGVVKQVISEMIDNIFRSTPKKKKWQCDDVECIQVEVKASEESSMVGELNPLEIEFVPDMAYFLSLDTLITVITTCLPWHARVQNVEEKSFREIMEEIYEVCRNSEFKNKVLCHEFLNHPALVEQLSKTCKFTIKNPLLIVEKLVERKDLDLGKSKK